MLSSVAQAAGTLAMTVFLTVACATSPDGDGDGDGTSLTDRVRASVVEVVDGDTIRVDLAGTVQLVRLIGIDAPETDGPFTDRECFGDEATTFVRDVLADREVELGFDVDRTDRFDRTLAYVWVDGSLFNERIVRDGFATISTFPPNVRYVDRFAAAQRDAREEGRGLWGTCPFGTPGS